VIVKLGIKSSIFKSIPAYAFAYKQIRNKKERAIKGCVVAIALVAYALNSV